jgi:hypothetical protein
VREAGVTIIKRSIKAADLKPGETMACGTIGICLEKFGGEIMILVLRAIRKSEGDVGGSLLAKIIFAVTNVLNDHREWLRDKRLCEAFAAIDLPVSLLESSVEAAGVKGLKTSDVLEAKIITHLDRSLTSRAVA